MVAEAIDGLGGIDVLVNNAGIQISRPTDELSSADFDKVLAVNLRGSFLCAREAIKHFLDEEKPGSIINVSSVHQLIPKPDYLGYSAQQGRHAEPDPHAGARVRRPRASASTASARARRSRRSTAAGSTIPSSARWSRATSRWRAPATADEMAGVTCFLASDDAAYITGQTIFVDGGLTLFPSFREPWSSE